MHYIFCIFISDFKNTQIFIVFIINHKNTINIMYLVRLLWPVVANKRFVKIFTPPLSCSPRGVFANLRVTFKLLLLNSDRTTIMGGFFRPSRLQIMMLVMLLWVYIHPRRAWKICPATVAGWIYTQSNITSIIFTWVHNTNTEKIKVQKSSSPGVDIHSE
jgi:hypothetical protein